jgi:hypothetical protein
MRERLNRWWAERRFARTARRVFATPPMPAGTGEAVLFSLVSARDLAMYLLAAKSVLRALPHLRVAVLDDGSLGAEGHGALMRHLHGIRILQRSEVATGSVPRDFTWERMFCSIALSKDHYVVQMDSDTIALGSLSDVGTAVASGRAFILAARENPRFGPLPSAVAWAATNPSNHIQMVSERAMGGLPGAQALTYVRGSSGFYGFPRATVTAEQAENLFLRMNKLTGGRFIEYGSEQFAANFLIANIPGAMPLPWPAYAVYDARPDVTADPAFLHFIGTYRYHGDVYARAAARVLATLDGSAAPA